MIEFILGGENPVSANVFAWTQRLVSKPRTQRLVSKFPGFSTAVRKM